MMRVTLMTLMGILFSVTMAMACDDHHGKCTLEGWRAQNQSGIFMLDGSATCDEGKATVRLYDGDKFLRSPLALSVDMLSRP